MKTILVLAALVAVAVAGPVNAQYDQQQVELLKHVEHDSIGVAQKHSYEYAQSDGHSKQEETNYETAVNEEGQEVPAAITRGSFSFTSPDGQQFTVTYVADKDGFHAQGDHLPVAPVASQ